jgi:hypothetical protein
MRTIGVTTTMGADHLGVADYVVASLRQIRVEPSRDRIVMEVDISSSGR